jgi:hypothetical protein
MNRAARRAFAVLGCWLSLALSASSQEVLAPEGERFFESKIRPVLVRECYSCHSSDVGQVRGGLWLDTAESLRSGGDSGPGVVPGKLDESLLWNAINHIDFVMPPRRKLSAEVLEDFRQWIEMGAPDPRTTQPASIRAGITDEDIKRGREFWSFQPPQHPITPVGGDQWASTDIDRFVWQQLEQHALTPAADAAHSVLLRRLSFDLLGLPPSPDQIEQFNQAWQVDPEATWQSTIDDMLEQPQFGERWGRHWLDLVRYAESTGREVNLTYPHAWRYRDYVIDSFNQDKPYDRFLQQQIAGDLLPAETDQQWAENLIATGFMALGPKALNEQYGRQFELDVIDEQIDVTTRVMLGVSIACARCHDHKFDPIPQADYYALSGIFRGMSTHYGTFRTQQNRRPSNLIELPVADARPLHSALSRAEMDQIEVELKAKQAELRDALLTRRDRQSGDAKGNPQQKIIQLAQLSSTAGLLQSQLDSYDSNGQPLSLCMAVQETQPTNTRLLERGEFNKPAQQVERGLPQVLCAAPPNIADNSTGRLELARWIGSSQNPLTARVMVNRIWQHLFGQALVRTPEDFGATGQAPTHPELLDYLAIEFMENNWSVKHMIRVMVQSRSYRMGSQYDLAKFELDPENRYLWRMEPKRLEAEAIRDSLLAISGEIDLKRPAGSLVAQAGTAIVREGTLFSLSPGQANSGNSLANRFREQVAGRALGTQTLRPVVESLEQAVLYRSVYLPVVRDNIPRALDVFDFAESTMVIGLRETSNTPDQGLFFLNNSFVIERAAAMARRVQEESSQPTQQIQYAFLLAYGRPASSTELRAAKQFMASFQTGSAPNRRPLAFRRLNSGNSTGSRAAAELEKLSVLCQSILASAEFRFVN